MKAKEGLILAALLALAVTATAGEWGGRAGIGLRGGLAPYLFPGSDFKVFDQDKQPFLMSGIGGAELRVGLVDWLALTGYYRFTRTYDDSTATGSQSFTFVDDGDASSRLTGYLSGLTANVYFRPSQKLQPYLLGGMGIDHWRLKIQDPYAVSRQLPPIDSTLTEGPLTKQIWEATDLVGVFGGGVNWWLDDHFTIDFQTTLTFGITNLDSEIPTGVYGPGNWEEFSDRPFGGRLEFSLGLSYFIGGARDSDQDGVNDKDDACPGTPLGAVIDERGCPQDGDGDGVYDGLDNCPNTPQGARVDALGCPLDGDNDGVYDGLDECPNTPVGWRVNSKGCSPDTDADGVRDEIDECPNTPSGLPVDARGCPIDADKDGVPDSVDKCLGTPAGVEVDETGCPVVEKITKIVLTDQVRYEVDSYQLSEEAKATLEEVVESMRAYPETRIKISGFCDATGPEDYNMELSRKRAEAVYDYLASQGISLTRMEAYGYGEDAQYFVADNDTREGRRKNRRVEIESIE